MPNDFRVPLKSFNAEIKGKDFANSKAFQRSRKRKRFIKFGHGLAHLIGKISENKEENYKMSEQFPNQNYDADEVINDFKSKFKWPKDDEEVNVVTAPPHLIRNIILSVVITLLCGGILYYLMLPSINLKDVNFYYFVIVLIILFMAFVFLLSKAQKHVERKEYLKKKSLVPIIIVGVLIVVMIIGGLIGATIFRAKSYSQLMTVETSDFEEDFEELSYNTVPRIDETRAINLADQQLGTLEEYKSQYVVADTTTLINYNGEPCRVAYLEYADVFKWFSNTKEGIPAYMIVNLVTQKVTVVNCLEEFGGCIQYSPTELFNEKLIRHVQFQYPTCILDTPNFEVTDDGYPYWITPVLDKTIGLFGGTDVKGMILTDAITGESQYYDIEAVKTDAELEWIDVVYSDDLLLTQYNYYGKLSGGFWNSIIFQTDVSLASDGNGYIALDGDIWVYTGVTSSESDTSNFGFVLCNQRTKETRYYANGGAIESAAMESAEDAVQNYGYSATFPILLDIDGNATYFMSLYGDGNTVKGYALVSLEDKTIVGTGLLDDFKTDEKALNGAVENYIEAMQDEGVIDEDVDAEDFLVEDDETDTTEDADSTTDDTETEDTTESSDSADDGTVTGEVESILTSVNDGNTIYYFEIDGSYYYIAVTDCMDALLVSTGDTITVTLGEESSGDFIEITDLDR